MKKQFSVFLLLFCLSATLASAQTVFPSTQDFDKVKKEGLSTSFGIDKKYIEKGWRLKLAEFGKVIVTKDVYSVTSATIPSIADAPINLLSKVYTQKGRTHVFMCLNLRDSLFVTRGHEKYAEAEKVLINFANLMNWEEDVRKAEEAYGDVVKKQEKVIRQGEKLVNNIDDNRKDKEKLFRKQDENKADHEALLKEQESNKTELANTQGEAEKLKALNPTEKEVATAQKKVEKAQKTAEKLVRKITDNEKDRDGFPRKFDDNKNELDKLTIDLDRNKQEQGRMLDEVAKAKKVLDDVKAKKPM